MIRSWSPVRAAEMPWSEPPDIQGFSGAVAALIADSIAMVCVAFADCDGEFAHGLIGPLLTTPIRPFTLEHQRALPNATDLTFGTVDFAAGHLLLNDRLPVMTSIDIAITSMHELDHLLRREDPRADPTISRARNMDAYSRYEVRQSAMERLRAEWLYRWMTATQPVSLEREGALTNLKNVICSARTLEFGHLVRLDFLTLAMTVASVLDWMEAQHAGHVMIAEWNAILQGALAGAYEVSNAKLGDMRDDLLVLWSRVVTAETRSPEPHPDQYDDEIEKAREHVERLSALLESPYRHGGLETMSLETALSF